MLLNLVLVVAMAAVHFLLSTRRAGLFTVDGIYSSVTLLMAVGTLLYVDPRIEADRVYGGIFTTGVVVYYFTSALFSQLSPVRAATNASRSQKIVQQRVSMIPAGLIALSVLVGFAYFAAVGYNVFLQGLQEFGSGASTNYQDMRIESYDSGQNLNPGYVNQFKNTILPTVTMFAIASMFHYGTPGRKPISVGLAVVNLVLLAGTGQRGALILALLGAVVFIFHSRKSKSLGWLIPVGLAAALPLVFLTYLLGRNADAVAAASGPFGKGWAVTKDLIERVLRVQQESGIFVFRFIYERPQVNGSEWVDAVLGVLPNHPGTSLPREAFEWLYGTDRGTATPSVWGSAYYNFGLVGVVAMGIVIGFGCQVITRRFHEANVLRSWDVACYAMFAATFGAWVAGGPEYLLNAGPVTVALLWLLGRALPDNEVGVEVARDAETSEGMAAETSQSGVR